MILVLYMAVKEHQCHVSSWQLESILLAWYVLKHFKVVQLLVPVLGAVVTSVSFSTCWSGNSAVVLEYPKPFQVVKFENVCFKQQTRLTRCVDIFHLIRSWVDHGTSFLFVMCEPHRRDEQHEAVSYDGALLSLLLMWQVVCGQQLMPDIVLVSSSK